MTSILDEFDSSYYCSRKVSDGNEQHDTEIGLARSAAEDDVAKSSDDVIQHVNSEFC